MRSPAIGFLKFDNAQKPSQNSKSASRPVAEGYYGAHQCPLQWPRDQTAIAMGKSQLYFCCVLRQTVW